MFEKDILSPQEMAAQLKKLRSLSVPEIAALPLSERMKMLSVIMSHVDGHVENHFGGMPQTNNPRAIECVEQCGKVLSAFEVSPIYKQAMRNVIGDVVCDTVIMLASTNTDAILDHEGFIDHIFNLQTKSWRKFAPDIFSDFQPRNSTSAIEVQSVDDPIGLVGIICADHQSCVQNYMTSIQEDGLIPVNHPLHTDAVLFSSETYAAERQCPNSFINTLEQLDPETETLKDAFECALVKNIIRNGPDFAVIDQYQRVAEYWIENCIEGGIVNKTRRSLFEGATADCIRSDIQKVYLASAEIIEQKIARDIADRGKLVDDDDDYLLPPARPGDQGKPKGLNT